MKAGAHLVVLGGAALAAAATARSRLALVTVRGNSMAPTFEDGDRVLALRRDGARYGRDDVVVFRAPVARGSSGPSHPAWLVKRVAAVAGDLAPGWLPQAEGEAERVPRDHVAVRGDNAHSQDSRHFGYVCLEAVTGVVVGRLGRVRR